MDEHQRLIMAVIEAAKAYRLGYCNEDGSRNPLAVELWTKQRQAVDALLAFEGEQS